MTLVWVLGIAFATFWLQRNIFDHTYTHPQQETKQIAPWVHADNFNSHLGFLLNLFCITSLLPSVWVLNDIGDDRIRISHILIKHTTVSKWWQKYHQQPNYWEQLKTFLSWHMPSHSSYFINGLVNTLSEHIAVTCYTISFQSPFCISC